MRRIPRLIFFIVIAFSSYFLDLAPALAEPLRFNTSTQYLWGDDWLGQNQSVIAQYMRFSVNPEGKPLSFAGYGRTWKDFAGSNLREQGLAGRLYYLYVDYNPSQRVALRFGRQFMNLTAGNSLMDGLRLDVHDLGPVGVTLAGGRDVVYTLDSESSRNGNNYMGIDVHLEKVKALQLGVSYVRKHDDWDLSREQLGLDARYFFKSFNPYAEVKYDSLMKLINEATMGVNIFPAGNLMLKTEFYYYYPTFDSTSIYSVFAADKYREYLLSAEYNLNAPVTLFGSYAHQTYEDDSNADRFTVGAKTTFIKNLTLSTSVDYRTGYGGNLFGFEVTGDYRIKDKVILAAGAQYDVFNRPYDVDVSNGVTSTDFYQAAQRYWVGGKWLFRKDLSLSARIEENVSKNFDHRALGRLALNWNF